MFLHFLAAQLLQKESLVDHLALQDRHGFINIIIKFIVHAYCEVSAVANTSNNE